MALDDRSLATAAMTWTLCTTPSQFAPWRRRGASSSWAASCRSSSMGWRRARACMRAASPHGALDAHPGRTSSGPQGRRVYCASPAFRIDDLRPEHARAQRPLTFMYSERPRQQCRGTTASGRYGELSIRARSRRSSASRNSPRSGRWLLLATKSAARPPARSSLEVCILLHSRFRATPTSRRHPLGDEAAAKLAVLARGM
jgi:hypothetical protein